MLPFVIVCLLLVCDSCWSFVVLPEQFMDPMEIIRYHGYPAERHRVTTEDGYILTLHRIPHGRNGGNSSSSKPAILLQHGLMCSSFDFLSPLPAKSLSYALADAGFDVWMGNDRGNRYSMEHVQWSTDDRRFWNFSLDEMASSDFPATVDFIINATNQSSVYCVAHSQGTLTFMAEAALNPEFAAKIKHFFALAPALSSTHMRGVFINSLTRFPTLAQIVVSSIPQQLYSFPATFPICGTELTLLACEVFMDDLSGTSEQLNKTRLPVFMSKFPGGTSYKNLIHWQQDARNGTRHFDYGVDGNLREYGTSYPRPYHFANYTVPTSLYFSPADHLVSTEDMLITLSLLPQNSIVRSRNLTGFGHFDFIWGDRAKTEIYDEIIDTLLGMK